MTKERALTRTDYKWDAYNYEFRKKTMEEKQ